MIALHGKTILLTIACFALTSGRVLAQEDNCFGIIAGKLATADGSVLMGHNEDDGGEQMLNIYVAGQRKGTSKFLWAEFPGLEVADALMNEHGVCVASDNCPSREDREDFSDGGILHRLRLDVAKYARSAREAVKIIGRDVERYGYRSSGRSYVVADSKEGWLVALVQGRHWVAQRVPDDKVMTIPNYYVIDKINLSDTLNFLGSQDIISYAIERGWYNPEKDGVFSFRKAYAALRNFKSSSNTNRHSQVLAFLSKGTYNYDVNDIGLAITPAHKLNMQDIIDALSLHGKPESNTGEKPLVCNDNTVLATVFQLRDWMPRSIGCVMWTCPGRPCSELFVPWYMGMTQPPKGWTRFSDWTEAEQKHFSDSKDLRKNYPDGMYWTYTDRWEKVGKTHQAPHSAHQTTLRKQQKKLFDKQKTFEQKLKNLPEEQLGRMLNNYTSSIIKKTKTVHR